MVGSRKPLAHDDVTEALGYDPEADRISTLDDQGLSDDRKAIARANLGAPSFNEAVLCFATMAALAAAVVPVTVPRVWVHGFYSPSDGGAHWREFVPMGTTLTSDMRQTANGRWCRVARTLDACDKMFGVKANSTGSGSGSGTSDTATDDTQSHKDYIVWARSWAADGAKGIVFRLGPGLAKISDTLDYSGFTIGISIMGLGRSQSGFAPTAFGASKSLLKFSSNSAAGRNSSGITLQDFQIRRGVQSKAHPVAIEAPFASRFTGMRVDVSGIGNSPLIGTSPFNCTWIDCQFTSCGYQPLDVMLETGTGSVKVQTTQNSTRVVATKPIYSIDHVGKRYYLAHSGDNDNFTSPLCARIAAYVSPTEIDLNVPVRRTSIDDRTHSFDALRGSITRAAPTTFIVKTANALDATDIGRRIYLPHLGYGGAALFTTLAGISQDTLTWTLADPVQGVSGIDAWDDIEVWLTPNIVWAGVDIDASSSYVANDVHMFGVNVENPRGPMMLCHRGVQIYILGCKFHGLASGNGNNFAQARHHIVNSAVNRLVVTDNEWEHGCHGPDSGSYLQIGNPSAGSSATIDNLTLNYHQCGGWLADIRSTGDPSYFQLGTVASVHDWSEDGAREGTLYRGNVRFASLNVLQRYHPKGRISGISEAADVVLQPEQGNTIVVQDDAVFTLPIYGGVGRLTISDFNGRVAGSFYVRTTSDPAIRATSTLSDITACAVGTPTGTTGTDGKATIYADKGKIAFENRTGMPLRFYWDLDLRPAGTLWAPGDAGLAVYAFWDADKAAQLSLTGSAVNSFTDGSGGIVVSQATGGLKPTYVPDGFGGRAAIAFNGATYLENALASLPIGNTPCEMWAVWWEQGAIVTGSRTIAKWGGTNAAGGRRLFRNSSTDNNHLAASAGDGTNTMAPVNSIDMTGPHVLRGRWLVDNTLCTVDNGALTQSPGTLNTSPGPLRIGALNGTPAANFGIGMLNALLVTAPATPAQAADIMAYLAPRVGQG